MPAKFGVVCGFYLVIKKIRVMVTTTYLMTSDKAKDVSSSLNIIERANPNIAQTTLCWHMSVAKLSETNRANLNTEY